MTPTQPHRVLVVEDEPLDRAFVVEALRSPAHEVLEAADAAAAREVLIRQHVDLMVLDLKLPDEHGLDFLASIRSHDNVPVLVVSGITAVSERVAALRMGADDFVVKPVDPGELSARCGALLRRAGLGSRRRSSVRSRFRANGFTIDLERREVVVDDHEVALTPIEFELLAYLVGHEGQVVTRADLANHVWKVADGRQVNASVTEHVRRLRNKLGDGRDGRNRVRTVRGYGYRFVV